MSASGPGSMSCEKMTTADRSGAENLTDEIMSIWSPNVSFKKLRNARLRSPCHPNSPFRQPRSGSITLLLTHHRLSAVIEDIGGHDEDQGREDARERVFAARQPISQ